MCSRFVQQFCYHEARKQGVFREFKVLATFGGAEGNRTPDLYNAIVALSQLSYGPSEEAVSAQWMAPIPIGTL
jgi:hypothetical protein